jgi:MFS family permease
MWNRNTVLLMAAQWLSFFGSKLHMLALPLIIYQRTGSTRLLALGFLAETLPWVILAPKLSIWFENRNSKRLLVMADLARACLCVLLAFMSYQTLLFLLIMFLIGSFNSFYGTFRFKVLKSSMPDQSFQGLLGITNSGIEAIQIAAPAVGGILLSIGMSAHWLLLIDAISFVVSAIILSGLKVRGMTADSQERPKSKVSHGFRRLLHDHRLRQTVVTEGARSLAEALFMPILIVVTKEQFHLQENYLGWVQSCLSIGALCMALLFIKLKSSFYRDMGSALSLLFLGLLTSLLIFGESVFVLLIVMILIGVAMSFRQMSAELALLENLPHETSANLISSYNSAISVLYVGGYVLSSVLSGYIVPLALSGGICVLAAIYQIGNWRTNYVRNQTLSELQP